jgi:hypothetical protein
LGILHRAKKIYFEDQKDGKSSRNLHGARKNILLGVKKVEISLQSPKPEFRAQNQYGRMIYPSFENFTWSLTISLQSPKTEFGAQNQYGRVIHRLEILNGLRKNILLR